MPPTPFDPLASRNRPRVSGSPLASSLPFDWDAAIHRRPPPYASPASQRKLRKRSSVGVGTSASGGINSAANTTPVRVFRKVPLTER